MSNYPDGFGSRPSDWNDPMSPLDDSPSGTTIRQDMTDLAEGPDVIDVQNNEPMLTLDQIFEILEEHGVDID